MSKAEFEFWEKAFLAALGTNENSHICSIATLRADWALHEWKEKRKTLSRSRR